MDAEDVGFTHLEELDGLITPDVGRVLYDYARNVPSDRGIVELGSYHGQSTSFLALGTRDGNGQTVYAIDTWSEEVSGWRESVKDRISSPSYDRFLAQLTEVGLHSQVESFQGKTVEAAAQYAEALAEDAISPVGMLFIDADHRYEAVHADFHAWKNVMADDGFIIFDDYNKNNPGVVQAVREFRQAGLIEPVVKEAGRLVITSLTKKGIEGASA